MPQDTNELYDLDIDEVSFVDKGANQHADIILLKRDGQLKTESGKQYTAEAYAYVPDPEKPSTWKLRLWESPEAKITRAQVGRAVAALGEGFRGQKVEIPNDDLQSVKNKVLEAWLEVNEDMTREDAPEILTKVEHMPTVEELQGTIEGLNTEIANLKAENQKHKDEMGVGKGGEGDDVEKRSDVPEDVQKQMDDIRKEADAAKEQIQKMQDEKDLGVWVNKCAEVKVEKGEEVAKSLHTVAKSHPEDAEKLYDTIKTLHAQVVAGDLFKEKGSSNTDEASAYDKAMAKAKEAVNKGEFKTVEKAFAHIFKNDAEIRKSIKKEQEGAK